jgi:hypothetical protein
LFPLTFQLDETSVTFYSYPFTISIIFSLKIRLLADLRRIQDATCQSVDGGWGPETKRTGIVLHLASNPKLQSTQEAPCEKQSLKSHESTQKPSQERDTFAIKMS